ncbi:MAG: AMP-binding protein [Gammaproteobacteria bacterium]
MNAAAMTDEDLHLATVWEAVADAIPDETALAHGTRSVTWREFDTRAARLAAAFAAAGLASGAKIAIDLHNKPEWLEAFFAAIKIRAVPANVNYRYLDRELIHLLRDAEAEAIVFEADFADRILHLAPELPRLRLFVRVGADPAAPVPPGVADYESLIATHAPAARIRRDAGDQYLSYTGGTTGLPKGVMVNLVASVRSITYHCEVLGVPPGLEMQHAEAARHFVRTGTRPVAIPASPLMHSTGLGWTALPTLCFGGQVVTLQGRSFDAHELLEAIERQGATIVSIVGDAFARPVLRALQERAAQGRPCHLPGLRQISSAGVAWSADTKALLFEHLPQVVLFDACGASEGITYGFRRYRKGDPLASASFTPAPGLLLLDDDGTVLAPDPGRRGLLANTTTAVGYFNDPDKTARTYRMIEGVRYAIPGDYGRFEADGTVTLLGRASNTVNTGGEKVHPEEVEDLMKSYPGVDDCLVFGIPDERFGMQVAAVVQMRPGAPTDAAAFAAWLRERIAHYKVPRRVEFSAVPRGPNGKPDYPRARQLVSA